MRRTPELMIIAAMVLSMAAGCGKGPAAAGAAAGKLADNSAAPVNAPKADVKPVPKVTIPAGTKLRIALLDSLSSDKSRAGDQFRASLAEPIVLDGNTVLSKGTTVRGRIIQATRSGRVQGRASIELSLTEILPESGNPVSISTKPYMAVAETTKKRDTAIIAGGAGLGAALGAIAGGGKGAAIGAAAGGGAGSGTVLATRGKEIHYAPETRLSFTLASPVRI